MAIQVVFEAVDKAALATLQKVAKGVDGVTEAQKKNKEQTGTAAEVWRNLTSSMTFANLATSAIQTGLKMLVDVMKQSVALAKESELALARLDATLTSTGRTSETTAKDLSKLATQMSIGTMFDDEAILESMNVLMRFDSVATQDLPKVTSAAMDMAAALGTDVPTAANQLGGALETGVIPKAWKFDKATKENIQSLLEMGDEAGALAVILENLGNKFEGQAEKMGSTATGASEQAKNAWNNYLESQGAASLQANESMNMFFANMFNKLTAETEVRTRVVEILREQGNANAGLQAGTNQVVGASQKAIAAAYELARAEQEAGIGIDQVTWAAGRGKDALDEMGKSAEDAANKTGMAFSNQERIGFIFDFQAQTDNLDKAREEIKAKMAAIEEEIRAARESGDTQAIPGLQEDFANLVGELQSSEEAFKKWQKQAVFSMIQTKLAADGLTDAEFGQLLGIGQDMGLLDEGVVAQAQGLMDTLSGVDTGSLEQAVSDVQYLISQDGRTIKIYVEQTVTDVPSGGTMPTTGMASTSSGGDTFINYGPQYFYGTTLSGILAEWR